MQKTLLLYNTSMLKKYDKSKMHKIYDIWPTAAKEFSTMNFEQVDFKNIDHVIFTGMGGSGAVGDCLYAILSQKNIHLSIVKGFHLPKTADSKTLVIATSASGDTLETIEVFSNAKKAGCKLIGFSYGGKLMQYCQKNKIEHRKIPIYHSPRASFPNYLYSILNVLEQILPIHKNEINESITTLEKTQKKINSSNLDDNPAIDIASWICGIPIIYYPMGLQAAATRFKNSLQENVKTHAIVEDVIEACHNGIMSWETKSNVCPILLQGKDDYIKTKILWKIIKDYFKKNKIDYLNITSVNGNILSKIVNLVYLLDYSTIYRAVITKVDPAPVSSINFVKRRMNNVRNYFDVQ